MAWPLTILALILALLLPRGTNVPYSRRPTITFVLIAVNLVTMVLYQAVDLWSGPPVSQLAHRTGLDQDSDMLNELIHELGFIPSRVWGEDSLAWLTLVTSQFIHGGWLHFITNIWFFYLFAVNVEDLFGRARYVVLVIATMLGTQLLTLFLTQGTRAWDTPHIGFSGVVYGMMGAYLVCFPRSSIRVVLIHSPLFWVFVLGPLTVVTGLLRVFFLGSASELLWVLLFIGTVVATDPPHVSFGIPAFVFLGARILLDAATIGQQVEVSQVSALGHAGGLLTGAACALLFNGTRGFRLTWDRDTLFLGTTGEARRQRKRHEEEQLRAAAESSDRAARELLARLVFMGHAMAATRFYTTTVMTRYPHLCLAPHEQHALARMLNTAREPLAALHAYHALFEHHGRADGTESAYLEAARLCSGMPGFADEAIGFLDTLQTLPAVSCDKLEGARLREALLAQAGPQRVPPGPTGTAESDTGQPTLAVEQPLAGDHRRSRMSQLQLSGKAPGSEAPTPPKGPRTSNLPRHTLACTPAGLPQPGVFRGDAGTTTFALLLPEGAAIRRGPLTQYVEEHLRGRTDPETVLAQGQGIVARGLARAEAEAGRRELAPRGVSVIVAAEVHPALTEAPLDVSSIDMLDEQVVLRGAGGTERIGAAQICCVTYAAMKITTSSRSAQSCIEIITPSCPRRIQIWERLLTLEHCVVDGTALASGDGFHRVLEALAARLPDDAFAPPARRSITEPAFMLQLPSYRCYENHIAYCVLARACPRI